MGCGSCATTTGTPKGCQSNGTCGTSGCNKLNVYDWLRDMELPGSYIPFNIVEIRFKGSRKEFFRNDQSIELFGGEPVVVEVDNGFDVGHVSLSGELVRLQLKKHGIPEASERIRKIYRKASDRDMEKWDQLKSIEPKTLERARTIALELGLQMKLSDIEFQGDGKKVVFFYTAEERVDFRELIKRYAEEFRVRIEMRQIGYRQEASRLGGIGSCGRELCCSTWLTDFKQVSISAARYQNLSINMLKLSGQCGRLKCCLNYELDTYLEALKEFPKQENLYLETQGGRAKSLKVDILKKTMWFVYEDSNEWIPVDVEKVNRILEQNKQGVKPADLVDRDKAAMALSRVNTTDDIIAEENLDRFEDKRGKQKKDKQRGRDRNRESRHPNSGTPSPKNYQGNSMGEGNQTRNNQKGNQKRVNTSEGENATNKQRPQKQFRDKPQNPRPEGQPKRERPENQNRENGEKPEGQNREGNPRRNNRNRPRGPRPDGGAPKNDSPKE